MVLPDVEVAVTTMVQRWQLELIAVQQEFGFGEVDDTMRRLEGQVDAVGGGGAVEDGCGLGGGGVEWQISWRWLVLSEI